MKSSESDKNQFDDLKRTIAKLSSDKIDLANKLDEKDREFEEYLKIATMAVVDCTDDFRVMNTFGAVDIIFKEVIKSFERGVNLIRMVHKITKNFKEKSDAPNIAPEDLPEFETSLATFVTGNRDEKDMKIVGESEDGEIFLLLWKIKRNNRMFRNYFRIIPSNAVIESAQQHHAIQMQNKDKEFRDILNVTNDGICILDSKSIITFMNDSARKMYLSNAAEVLKKANIEGKYFRELFITEDVEDLNKRLNFNSTAIVSKSIVKYNKMTNGRDVEFTIYPTFDKFGVNNSLVIVSKVHSKNDALISSSNLDQKKIAATIRQLLEEKQIAKARIKELEINQKWFSKKISELNENTKIFHKTIKSLYSYLENIPLPVSILQLPTEKYEFVNRSFETYLAQQRSSIINKTDEDIFDEKLCGLIKEKTIELQKTNIPNEIITNELHIKQTLIYNENHNPIQVVRVFVVKN